jgi:glycosyltransferase involved in cell wall biosynthesis
MSALVSVIIPVYNAELFVKETIQAVLLQDYSSIEILVINDGSTDRSGEVVLNIDHPSIRYFTRMNMGVSSSRNFGLNVAKGDFVLFLDSDDILPPTFISERIKILLEFSFFGFSCGFIKRIDENGNVLPGIYKSACNNISSEVLTFYQDIVTCPSSYLYRKSDLLKYDLKFNENLSSSADRYFLLQIDKYLKGFFIRNQESSLLYRIRNNSMSNNLNYSLIKDNELFFELVSGMKILHGSTKRVFLSKSNYVLAGAYFKIGKFFLSLKFSILSFLYDPINFFRTMFKIEVDNF